MERAIFIAAPHQGTDIAGNKVGRLIGRLVRLPLTLLGKFEDVFLALAQAEQQVDGTAKPKIPNSIDNLKASDPFVPRHRRGGDRNRAVTRRGRSRFLRKRIRPRGQIPFRRKGL